MTTTKVIKSGARVYAEIQLRIMFRAAGNLGFDTPQQALQAIEEATDWRERYDFTGDRELLAQLNKMGY